jgi:hypothetical protein
MEGLEMKAVALMNYMRSGTGPPVHFCFPQTGIFRGVFSEYHSPERSVKLRWEGRGTLYFIASVPSGRITPYVAIFRGFLLYGILYSKLRWAGRGAHRPVLRVFGPKKTGAHSAREAKPTNFKIFFFIVSQIW